MSNFAGMYNATNFDLGDLQAYIYSPSAGNLSYLIVAEATTKIYWDNKFQGKISDCYDSQFFYATLYQDDTKIVWYAFVVQCMQNFEVDFSVPISEAEYTCVEFVTPYQLPKVQISHTPSHLFCKAHKCH